MNMKTTRFVAALTLIGGLGILSYLLLDWNRGEQVLGVTSSRETTSVATSSAKTVNGLVVWDASLANDIFVATDKFSLGDAVTIQTAKGSSTARVNKQIDNLGNSVVLRVNTDMFVRLGGNTEAAANIQATVSNQP